jgi:hypothetical protein
VFGPAVLGGDPPRRRRKSKEDEGSTPHSRSKTPFNKGFPVHLYASGAGMGLGSELLHILSFLPQPLANCRFGCLLHLTGYIWRKVKEGYA